MRDELQGIRTIMVLIRGCLFGCITNFRSLHKFPVGEDTRPVAGLLSGCHTHLQNLKCTVDFYLWTIH
jgi:hypothetical protein